MAVHGGKREQGEAFCADTLAAPATVSGEAAFHRCHWPIFSSREEIGREDGTRLTTRKPGDLPSSSSSAVAGGMPGGRAVRARVAALYGFPFSVSSPAPAPCGRGGRARETGLHIHEKDRLGSLCCPDISGSCRDVGAGRQHTHHAGTSCFGRYRTTADQGSFEFRHRQAELQILPVSRSIA